MLLGLLANAPLQPQRGGGGVSSLPCSPDFKAHFSVTTLIVLVAGQCCIRENWVENHSDAMNALDRRVILITIVCTVLPMKQKAFGPQRIN